MGVLGGCQRRMRGACHSDVSLACLDQLQRFGMVVPEQDALDVGGAGPLPRPRGNGNEKGEEKQPGVEFFPGLFSDHFRSVDVLDDRIQLTN